MGGPSQGALADLANQWEPEASASPPSFRRATCVVCAQPMERMWHLWLQEGGFKKEIHMCARCGMDHSLDSTLIVVACYGLTNPHVNANQETWLGGDLCLMDTSTGGHPTRAFIEAYRANRDYTSYLFIQDSMRGIMPDIVEPFRHKGLVVAWVKFGFNFDDPAQEAWVRDWYPAAPTPSEGIFGPTFYATRDAMERAEPFFPRTPRSKHEAQGTERAWAFAFQEAGIQVTKMYEFSPNLMQSGQYPPFSKTFADRS